MFGHHDETTQDDQAITPTDDGILANLPMPDNNEPMIIESNDNGAHADMPAVTPQSFRQSSPIMGSADMPSTATAASDGTADDLISIKQEALQHLKPLVGHLEQTPDEKFRTTMMMIQAADDQSLIPEAFAAAKAITDDKARAQALLDVVNEINYFTSQHAPTATA